MDEFIKNCRALLEKITMRYDANWIAFSGGLDSSILGQIKKDRDLNALTIIAKDFIGTDLSYSQIFEFIYSYFQLLFPLHFHLILEYFMVFTILFLIICLLNFFFGFTRD